MDSSSEDRHFIGGLQTFAILCLVFVTSAPYAGITGQGSWQLLLHPLQAIAFPLLFMCEGFMAATRRRIGFWRELWRGFRELLLPWLAFTALYTALRLLFELIGAVPEYLVLQGNGHLFSVLYRAEAAPALVVLPALFLLRALRPLATSVMRLSPVYAVALAVCAAVLFQQQHETVRGLTGTTPNPLLYTAWGVPFFAAGIALARCGPALKRFWPLVVAPLALLYGFGQTPGGMLFADTGYQYILLTAIFVLFMGMLDRPHSLHRLGRLAVPVLVLHAPVLVKGIQSVLVPLDLTASATWAGIASLAIAVTFIAARMLEVIPGGRWLIGTMRPRPNDRSEPIPGTETP